MVGALKKTHEGCEKYVVLQVKRRTNTETPREEQASCITGTARPMWPELMNEGHRLAGIRAIGLDKKSEF